MSAIAARLKVAKIIESNFEIAKCVVLASLLAGNQGSLPMVMEWQGYEMTPLSIGSY
jgi:hypothetical protein